MDKYESFQHKMTSLHINEDWFSRNITHWAYIFNKYNLVDKKLTILEIGSWEGLSSYYLLDTLPLAHLTSVDLWRGCDKPLYLYETERAEKNFDLNMAKFSDRVTKYAGTSFRFFNENKQKRFDLIYIDASHHGDDVIIDAIKAFQQLSVGGLLIFDDYFFKYFRAIENPAGAINFFIKMRKKHLKIVSVNYQVIIEKTSDLL